MQVVFNIRIFITTLGGIAKTKIKAITGMLIKRDIVSCDVVILYYKVVKVNKS